MVRNIHVALTKHQGILPRHSLDGHLREVFAPGVSTLHEIPNRLQPEQKKQIGRESALLAINTCPPGLKACTDTLAHSIKKRRRESRSFRSRAVNLGSGARVLPSNDGGIPPYTSITIRPFFNLVKLVFFYTIWRISYNRMDTVLRDSAKPLETICMHNKRSTNIF